MPLLWPVPVCTALVVTTKLIGPDLINAVYPMVVERLRHPKEHVRKKVRTVDLPVFARAPSVPSRPWVLQLNGHTWPAFVLCRSES